MKYRSMEVAAVCMALGLASTEVMAASVKYSCHFPVIASPEGLKSEKAFALEFAFDDVSKDAFVVGNQGVSPVMPVNGRDGISFIEVLATGAVQTTTVAKSGRAVHSRNTLIYGDPVPSQYYGKCLIKRSR